jgi:hypothetical protein
MKTSGRHSRNFRRRAAAALAAAACALAGQALVPAAAPAGETLSVRQVEYPLPLLAPGDRPEVGYDAHSLPSATGVLYVRSDPQRRFTAVPLTLRKAARWRLQLEPNDSARLLRASIPGRLVRGSRLFYYAVIRDGRGRSVQIPAAGAKAPRAAWILGGAKAVDLGVHRFGHPSAPEAVVARAGAGGVSFPTGEPCCGPSSFDVDRDRSIWLLDGGNQRLLVWRGAHPDAPRALRMPIPTWDFALGAAGEIYVAGHCRQGCVLRLSGSGKQTWQTPLADAGFPTQLRLGPDGTLYSTRVSESSSVPWRGRSWTPLTTPNGKPLSVAEQRRRTLWGFQPSAGRLRLVTAFAPYNEERVALVDSSGRVARAWRITSRTRISPALTSTPGFVDGDPVVTLEAQHGAGKSFQREYVVLRLAPSGTRARLTLREAAWGEIVTDLRVGPDGKLYQLASSPQTSVSVSRFALD